MAGHLGPARLASKGPQGAFQEMSVPGPTSLAHTGVTLHTALALWPCSPLNLSSPAREYPHPLGGHHPGVDPLSRFPISWNPRPGTQGLRLL